MGVFPRGGPDIPGSESAGSAESVWTSWLSLSDSSVARSGNFKSQLEHTIRDQAVEPPAPEAIDRLEADLNGMARQQRQAFAVSLSEVLTERMESQLREFFELPPEEQRQKLDDRIDRIQRARQLARSRQRCVSGSGPTGSRNRAPRWQATPSESPSEGKKAVLDHTTPELRGMQAEYTRLLNERMRQRGVTPISRR